MTVQRWGAGPACPRSSRADVARAAIMRFLHVVASKVGFRDPDWNATRMVLLAKLLELAGRQGARLLVLPGGFLAARDRAEMLALIDQIDRRATEAAVAVIGGVDLDGPDLKGPRGKGAAGQDGSLPYFGFAAGPLIVRHPGDHPWRQTSTNNQNAWLVADEDVPGQGRLVAVDEVEVAVLICGELFSTRARGSIAGSGAALVLDLGHLSMSRGLVPAMLRVARDGNCAVAHSQHVAWTTASIHFVDAEGQRRSDLVSANGLVRQGDLWAGLATRDLLS